MPNSLTSRRLACLAVLAYVAVISFRPLNANDLFWHLATGREILHTGTLPRADPFSFASDGGQWIDHEWLWQIAAQSLFNAAARGNGPTLDASACFALIVAGVLVVSAAFAVALRRVERESFPAGGIVLLGLVAAEVAKERLMVRPESASLLFLAIVLSLLRRGSPGLGRAFALAAATAIWANIHPACLLVPGIVLLHGVGEVYGASPGIPRLASAALRPRKIPRSAAFGGGPSLAAPAESGSVLGDGQPEIAPPGRGAVLRRVLLEGGLAAAGTLLNPYGWRLWTVPFALSRLVRTETFFNPEWLRPPLGRFPLFYLAAALIVAAALATTMVRRRPPGGPLLVALLFAALGAQQMRHMGLFAIALLFAAGPLLRSFDAKGRIGALLGNPRIAAIAGVGVLVATIPAAVGIWGTGASDGGLDRGRFPVEACERLEARAPGMRLYNDVQFGGYLIWRFFPDRQVFIDGRNELYPRLLQRLAGVHSGASPYAEWRALVGDLGIEGAIVRYKDGRKGVIYPPAQPGGQPVLGYRAWSAFLFPASEWGLVYFDDTAVVFMKRGGRGESWIRSGEYRDYNPEDRDYLLERAAQDPSFAARVRKEAQRRVGGAPACKKAEQFLRDLDAIQAGRVTRE